MTPSHFFSVLSICLKMGMRNIYADKILVLGSYWVYAVLIILYGGVIRLIPHEVIQPFGLSVNQMIWYVGATELMTFCATDWWYKEFQMDIQSARVHLTMIKPFPAFWLRIFVWLGEGVARLVFMTPAFLLICYSMTGEFLTFSQIAGFLTSFPCSIIIMACGAYIVGGSCLWFALSDPVFWVWQKCIFLFGALVWPLAFYPEWAREILFYTPFPAILAWAGNWTLDVGAEMYLIGYIHQIVWALIALLAAWRFEKHVFHTVQVRGV